MDHDGADTGGNRAESEDDESEIRYDDWPIQGYEGETDVGPAYLGTYSADTPLVFYAEEENAIFEAAVDEERERLVPREGTRRELESGETLGDALAAIGDRLEWESLSAFAREHFETTEETGSVDDPRARATTETTKTAATSTEAEAGVDPEAMTFTRSNVAATADHDLEFSGSITYRSGDDQVFIVERTFEGVLGEVEADVTVTERVLEAEEPETDRRSGDAERRASETRSFAVERVADEDETAFENRVEGRCQEWHESHVEPIA